MNQQFMKQAEEMMRAAQAAQMPEGIQAMTEDGLAKSRAAYKNMTVAAKDAGAAMENVTTVAQKGAKTLGEKMFANMSANAEAMFAAAAAMAKSKSLPEAAKIQADFMQRQFAKAGEQSKEFYELSTKVAKETVDTVNKTATKTMDKMKAQA